MGFDSAQDFQRYVKEDPAHLEFVSTYRELFSDIGFVDYVDGDL